MDKRRCSRPGLDRADRRRLERATAATRDARLYRRLQALAEVANGEPVAAVARRLRIERSTVHRWIDRYLAARDPLALADGRRTGRPRAMATFDEARLRQLLLSDPRSFGRDANTWTVALLAAQLRAEGVAIGERTLRRRIREARFRWKRPRYVYSERADHVGPKKGGSSDG